MEWEANHPNRQLLWNRLPQALGQPGGPEPRLAPGKEPVLLAQALAFAPIRRPALVQAKEAPDSAPQQQRQQHVAAKAPVGYRQVAGLEAVEQASEQAQFGLVFVALGVVQQHAGGQTEHPQQPQQRKAATGLLAARLGIGALGFLCVREAERGGINDLGPQAVPDRKSTR